MHPWVKGIQVFYEGSRPFPRGDRMHCKKVFNFALRHDVTLLQDNAHLSSLKPIGQMGGVLIDSMITVCEINIAW